MDSTKQIVLAFVCHMAAGALGQVVPVNRVLETTVSCDDRSIYFRIRFERPFNGLIYTESGFPNCVYVNGTVQSQIAYDVKIPLDSCLTRQMPNRDYENSVIVQENPSYLESSDRKYLLTCVPQIASSRDGTFTVNFGGVTVQGTLPSTEVVKGSGPAGDDELDYRVEILSGWGVAGRSVAGPLSVGDNIAYVVRLPNIGSSDARIGRCWAQDDVSRIELSDDRGCSLQSAGNVWGKFKSSTDGAGGRTLYNDIKAWAFPTSNKVNIFCNLHVCVGKCPKSPCRANYRRRRRMNYNDEEIDKSIETIEAGFRVDEQLSKADNLWAHETGSINQRYHRDSRLITSEIIDSEAAHQIDSGSHVCVHKAYFAVGLALLIILCSASVIFLAFAAHRLYFGGNFAKDTCSTSEHSHPSSHSRSSGRLSSNKSVK